jgi:DNA-directed RNA polymerase subunit K/omega
MSDEEEEIYEPSDNLEENDDEEISVDNDEETEIGSDILSSNEEIGSVSDLEYENMDVYNVFEDNEDFTKLYHPEEVYISFDKMNELSIISRDKEGNITDDNHKTYPLLSKYEKTKIIGLRVSQLNKGAKPYIETTNLFLDKSIIAEKELIQKKLPFIIQRPIPNGTFEYWNIKDLEII